jgi:DNA-binding response OmpR family regulator
MLDKKKVLIVEDSKLLRAVVQDALEQAGFEIYEAENGLLGLETAKNIHPDLIMLDVMMPVMDGLTMYQELRKDDWGKSVPVIMLTGAEEERVMSWINTEGLDYFKKEGWMMDEVVTHVNKLLDVTP